MAFDFKKEYRDLYRAAKKPTVVAVPPMTYLTVRGSGDPNEEGGAYKQAVGALYAVAYTIKMSKMGPHAIEGYLDFVVPPLEGFWWQPGRAGIDLSSKASFEWIAAIAMPDFVTPDVVSWAAGEAAAKKDVDASAVRLTTVDEGLCAQILHVGPYDDEPATIAALDAFAADEGYSLDMGDTNNARHHHEIYLSNPQRTAPEKLKTLIRHPISAPVPASASAFSPAFAPEGD